MMALACEFCSSADSASSPPSYTPGAPSPPSQRGLVLSPTGALFFLDSSYSYSPSSAEYYEEYTPSSLSPRAGSPDYTPSSPSPRAGFGLKQRSPRSCKVDLRWNNCFLALNKMEGGTKVSGMICSKQPKDRFAAKRLRAVADKLDSDKRAIIEQKSAFRSLLNVSPFNIPNELIDYVAQHTSSVLREFKVGKKRIVFTKDMVTKVFGIVSGCKPVVSLKRSEQSSLRDVYRGSNPRPDIPTTIKILTECDVTDEDTIVRSWDLLCMATVVDPRSSNHVGMDYLGSMSDPSKTHEYAWDEYILDLAMKEVNKMHKKQVKPLVVKGEASKFEYWISGPFAILGIVYMDHLEFPPNNYVMDYSLPRACHVKCSDFEFAVVNDLDRLSLNNKKVFGRRPFLDFAKTPYSVAASEPVDVPEVNPSASLNEWIVFPSSQEIEVPDRYKHLHEKHKAIFASDVDVATKNLAIGLKRMHSQRMSALLIDVDAAMREGDGPSVTFPNVGATRSNQEPAKTTNVDVQKDQEPAAKQGHVHEDKDKENDVHEVESDENDSEDDEVPEAESEGDLLGDAADFICAAKVGNVPSHRAAPDVPQSVVMTDASCFGGDTGEQHTVDSPLRSPSPGSTYSCIPAGISEEAWNRAPDPPTFELLSQDYFEKIPHVAAPAASDKMEETETELSCEDPVPLNIFKDVVVNGDNTADADLNTVAPMAEGGEPVTPIVPKSPAAMIIVSGSKDATTGPDTLAKKNSKEFVRIGWYFCSYKSFHDSLKPRQYLSSEVMNVWIEKFNREAKIVSQKKLQVKEEDQLIVDPAAFDLDACMKELRNINSKFKVLKDDLLYFPIVKDGHWITCCINICFEEFHIFDSMKTAKDSSLLEQYALNLFANFNRLMKESGLSKINFDEYLLTSPDHPHQTTLFDCGFFTQIFMENFDGKLMTHFDNNAIPDHRKLVATSLIENRDNGDDAVEAVMEEDLVKTKKK
ncbi:hypothetical protein ACQ4PT_057953 [Festuca glaucescens]